MNKVDVFDDTIEYTASPISVEFYVKKLNETQDGGVCLGFFCMHFCLP